jgi:hypothetical protein
MPARQTEVMGRDGVEVRGPRVPDAWEAGARLFGGAAGRLARERDAAAARG